jgi:hypothetical protein
VWVVLIFFNSFLISEKMNKIMIAALSAKFGADAPILTEICQNTGNPASAVEMLLGVFEMPEIKEKGKKNGKGEDLRIKSVNPLSGIQEQVEYTHFKATTRWFESEEEGIKSANNRYAGSSDETKDRAFPCVVEWKEEKKIRM